MKERDMINRSFTWKTIFAFTAIYVIWGSTYLAIRYAVETIPPFLMMGARSVIAGLILVLWSRSRGAVELRREHLPALFIIGISFFLVGHGLLAWAQQRVPSGLAAVLVASEPLTIFLIERFFTRDTKIKMQGMFGLLLGFAAIVYLIASTKGIDTSDTDIFASIAIVFGASSWAAGAVYSRVAKLPGSPVTSAGIELIIGGIFLLLAGAAFGEMREFRIDAVSLRSLLSLGYLIVFGSVITFSAYIWLLGHTSATRISTHTYVNPLIAILLGWLIASEELTIEMLIATVFIVISVALVLNDPQKSSSRDSH
ncbi:MAG: EamA family transporter [Bacteroidota bacterium]